MSGSGSGPEPRLLPGRPLPLGATPRAGGVNFAVVSGSAAALELVLFAPEEPDRERVWRLDVQRHRTGAVWHAFVAGVDAGWEYGYRVARPGPASRRPDLSGGGTAPGSVPLLLDPYARATAGAETWGAGGRRRERRGRIVRLSEAAPASAPWRRPLAESVLYELHVRTFTRHPSSSVAHPGTYGGLAEKIPYLKSLGVTAVELLPIAEFEENDNPRNDPETGEPLRNLWGYQPLAFLAPKAGYAATAGGEVAELRAMVEEFHRAGIEVLLDVVFNHTGEGDAATGWCVSWRGLDEELYYLVDEGSGDLVDLTGCGNTVRCQHPVVRRLIVDCLRYWVVEMGIDGFRFDLASVLGRGIDGVPLAQPPLLEEIALDPVLREVKLIAEPWDLGGLYQVGSFPHFGRFAEWNGRFRDDMRRFLRGEPGSADAAVERLLGSPDLYRRAGRPPWHGINYVTCHDGFTLADLVSYERKHNLRNGENERDGTDDNLSWNCGVEGPTDDGAIIELRRRQTKNFLALLLLARGVPMILAGDEMGRTQMGNNNAYCQDNELSWVDWSLVEREDELVRFVGELIRLRSRRPLLRAADFGAGEAVAERAAISTLPVLPPPAPFFGVELADPRAGERLLVIANATGESLSVTLPVHGAENAGGAWHCLVDTALDAPADVDIDGQARVGAAYGSSAHSVVLLGWRATSPRD